MAEDKSKTVIVKARAKAFLTSKPEEEPLAVTGTMQKKTVSRQQKSVPSAAEIAASIRKGEASKNVENISKDSTADTKKSAAVVVKVEPMINGRESFHGKNKLLEGGRLKKIPACKMAEPMKRPADDTLIITGKVTAASKRIQAPVAAVKPAAVKVEEVKAEKQVAKPEPEQTAVKPTAKPAVKKAEPKKAAAKPVAKPVVKKEEPKKAAAKPAVKKAEPKKAVAKPAAKPAVKKVEPKKAAAKPTAKPAVKKAEMVQNTYIQYQNETYNEADLIASAEKLWTKDMKRKAADLKSLELYVKPQERMAYCVFNKKETGSFAI